MWLLGVRDVRCYAVACAWPAVAMAIAVGTVGSFFPLVVALVWRLRHRDLAWLLVALLVAVKLLLWPLALYLLLTRRWRAFTATSAGILAFVLVPWAALGFEGLLGYPRLLAHLDAQEGKWSLGLPNLAQGVHLPSWVGMLLAVGLATLAFTVRDDERALFTVCLVLSIAASPLVWLHYFVLLLVPTALLHQRLSGLWVVPVVTVIAVYPTMTAPSLATLVIWWSWALLVVFAAVRARPAARTFAPTPPAHSQLGAAAT